jgi:hypothetical protein
MRHRSGGEQDPRGFEPAGTSYPMPRPPSRRARISALVMLRTRRRTRALPATCQQRRLLWPRVPSACLNLPGCLAGATKWKRRRRRHTWDRGEVFTRQKSQVRSLSRPPAKMLPTLAPRAVCQKICQKTTARSRRPLFSVARSGPWAGRPQLAAISGWCAGSGRQCGSTLEFPAAAALVPMSSSITRAGMPASSSQVEKLCRRSCGPRSCRCARSLWAR